MGLFYGCTEYTSGDNSYFSLGFDLRDNSDEGSIGFVVLGLGIVKVCAFEDRNLKNSIGNL